MTACQKEDSVPCPRNSLFTPPAEPETAQAQNLQPGQESGRLTDAHVEGTVPLRGGSRSGPSSCRLLPLTGAPDRPVPPRPGRNPPTPVHRAETGAWGEQAPRHPGRPQAFLAGGLLLWALARWRHLVSVFTWEGKGSPEKAGRGWRGIRARRLHATHRVCHV